MTIDELLTKFWKGRLSHDGWHPDIADFSDDRTANTLLRWFGKEKREMWWAFRKFSQKRWIDTEYLKQDAEPFTLWLFSKEEGSPYMRWVVLLDEWLRLEETRGKWGWEEHYCSHCRKGGIQMHHTHPCEQSGGVGGRKPAPWLEERRKG